MARASTAGLRRKRDGDDPRTQADPVRWWLNEIEAARKREKEFRETGEKVNEIYAGEHTATPFNILFSNTETLFPALYSATPRPVVQRRFKDDDPLGKAAAKAGERVLAYLLDTNAEGYETFDGALSAATLDALLCGRAVTTVKYDAQIAYGMRPADGGEPDSVKTGELVCLDVRSWDRVYFGFARRWTKVPWVAYEEWIDKEEAVRLFGRATADKLVFSQGEEDEVRGDRGERAKRNGNERDMGERKTALVYQIWDKSDRKIRYVAPSYADGLLKTLDDPLGLTGFFNCPEPLGFLCRPNSLKPVAPYTLYAQQATELNEITRRISRVTKAIKAKAVYDSELGEDIKALVEADDNELVPADKSSSLAAEKGLQNAIWAWPIDRLVVVLRELIVAREQVKQTIYEITGIADVMRGQSNASETLGAQEIKQSWGTLRLKRMQRQVQRYVRDLLRMMLEVAVSRFSEETLAAMTGLSYLTGQQRVAAEASAQSMQLAGGPLDPRVAAALQAPAWPPVMALLREDALRGYRIDIETNSTVEPEAVEDQKQISELLNALGQYLNGVAPLVARGVMPFGVAQNMLLAIARRFRFGTEIEDDIKQMQPPQPEDDGQAAKLAEMQAKMQAESQQAAAKLQLEAQVEQGRARLEMEKLAMQERIAQADREAEMAREAARIKLERDASIAKLRLEREITLAKVGIDRQTELDKTQQALISQVEIARVNADAKAVKQADVDAAGQQKLAEGLAPLVEQLQALAAQLAEMMAAMAAPVEFDRGTDGVRSIRGHSIPGLNRFRVINGKLQRVPD